MDKKKKEKKKKKKKVESDKEEEKEEGSAEKDLMEMQASTIYIGCITTVRTFLKVE